MSEEFYLIDPASLRAEGDIRVTTYDLFKILQSLGGTQNHHQILSAAVRDFGDEVELFQQTIDSKPVVTVEAGILDADMALSVASSMGGVVGPVIRRYLRSKLRDMRQTITTQAERIRTLEANQLAADTLREHWGAIEQRFDDYTQMSIKVQNKHPSKHGDELRYKFDLCYSAVKGVMRNAIAMTNTLPTKGETPCPTK